MITGGKASVERGHRHPLGRWQLSQVRYIEIFRIKQTSILDTVQAVEAQTLSLLQRAEPHGLDVVITPLRKQVIFEAGMY